MTPAEALIKRILDVVISASGLILLSPVLLALALLIWAREGTPVLYAERRMGRHHQQFTLFKFRSLSVNAPNPAVVAVDDERLTGTGRWLRRWHLDELPQLWTVFIGAMSMVGPRPMKPEHARSLPAETVDVVLSVKPGLTGPDALEFLAEDEALAGYPDAAALYSRYVLPAKALCICHYLANFSLWQDMQIMLLTARHIFSAKSYTGSRVRIRDLLPEPGPANAKS